MLTDSLAMEWSPEQAAVLKQTEGTESVVQAVARVQDLAQARHPSKSVLGQYTAFEWGIEQSCWLTCRTERQIWLQPGRVCREMPI